MGIYGTVCVCKCWSAAATIGNDGIVIVANSVGLIVLDIRVRHPH